jgi:predicted porin
LAVEAQLSNGGNTGTNNAFQGDIGFDYMGFSMDFLGGHTADGISAAPLTTGVVTNVAIGQGQVAVTPSDNTYFQVGARYAIGPWKLFAGYENIHQANPNNPLAPGAFLQGGFVAGQVNNCNFGGIVGGACVNNDKVLQTAWFGVRYSITPSLDITGAYYHEWQNTFAVDNTTLANCAIQASLSSKCHGTLDAVSGVIDWRFARHMDVYAGVMWSQVNGGLASGFLEANGTNAGTALANGRNHASNVDPGVGLRYQF